MEPSSVRVQRVSVAFDYPVGFTRGIFDPENPMLVSAIVRKEQNRRHRVFVIVDDGVATATPGLLGDVAAYAACHADRIVLAAEPHVLPGGEGIKSDTSAVADLLRRFDELALDRQSFVLIVGGGALLDMAGYAAAITHRGIRVIRIPTTVLSQADSGVGVKNGVNAFGKKNFIGTFAPPWAVLNDANFLETLGKRDKISGMAEAVKVALVRDAAFFGWLHGKARELRAGELESLEQLVIRSAQLHLNHIATSGDPFELGSARPLDFGHWAAHKLESLTAHRLRHGEAVAIGIALDALASAEHGFCGLDVANLVVETLEQLGFTLWDDALEKTDARGLSLLAGLEEFREHLGGELTVTMLRDIGEGFEVHELRTDLVLASLQRLRNRMAKHREEPSNTTGEIAVSP